MEEMSHLNGGTGCAESMAQVQTMDRMNERPLKQPPVSVDHELSGA
jgi:hypothetical protein